jgi:hypothetical protein
MHNFTIFALYNNKVLLNIAAVLSGIDSKYPCSPVFKSEAGFFKKKEVNKDQDLF